MEPTQTPSSSKLHQNPSVPLENSPWSSHFYPRHHQSWLNHHPSSMFFPSHSHSHNFNLNNLDEDDNQASTDNNNNNNNNTELIPTLREREPMFEKPLTPSDVGKLNRLVIPKQHAEKYFPLAGGDSGDKGLLLSFEDESGKFWRFRYSYWNSSQSYVLTKGWSRYVKEKQLDAGDVISFQRHRSDADRLYIGWRRRGAAVAVLTAAAATLDSDGNTVMANSSGGGGGGCGGLRYQVHPYLGHIQGHGANVPYQPDCLHAGIYFLSHCKLLSSVFF